MFSSSSTRVTSGWRARTHSRVSSVEALSTRIVWTGTDANSSIDARQRSSSGRTECATMMIVTPAGATSGLGRLVGRRVAERVDRIIRRHLQREGQRSVAAALDGAQVPASLAVQRGAEDTEAVAVQPLQR